MRDFRVYYETQAQPNKDAARVSTSIKDRTTLSRSVDARMIRYLVKNDFVFAKTYKAILAANSWRSEYF